MTGPFLSKISLKDSQISPKIKEIKIFWIALYYILKIKKLAKVGLLHIYQILMTINKNLKKLKMFSLKLSSIPLINNKKAKQISNNKNKFSKKKKSIKTNKNKYTFIAIQYPNH